MTFLFQQESDGCSIPALTLPSIHEDDENQHDEHETSQSSPNKNGLQKTNTRKYIPRFQEVHDNTRNRPRLGGVATNHLAMLRERVERQRSIVIPTKDLNCEIKNDVENTRNSVDKLDTQITTLHQDVATLSIEVIKK